MKDMSRTCLKNNILEKIETGGSRRGFYRCKYLKKTAILIIDPELKKYLKVREYLKRGRIDVPDLYWTDHRKTALLEDLGSGSLCAVFRKKPVLTDHKKAIDMLIKIQNIRARKFPITERYDREHVKWEQDYFKKHFLVQYARVDRSRIKRLKDEFDELTDQVMAAAKGNSKYFMHRDFQSQNIYIQNGKLHVIDFQSARIGPLTYDLSSLLRDPYVNLTVEQERKLFDYYYRKMRTDRISYERLQQMYRLTCIQRNMQALGAYANLALNKGKRHFLKYIPRGLQLLARGLREKNFERLFEIMKRCRGVREKR